MYLWLLIDTLMKITSMAKANYESPQCREIDIDMQALICTSPFGEDTERYDMGDTSDWFNN